MPEKGKPGRPLGSKSRMTMPHTGSKHDKMLSLGVGEHIYFEAEGIEYESLQRSVSIPSRRPKCMQGMEFTSSVYTAVGGKRAHDIKFLVRVERTK